MKPTLLALTVFAIIALTGCDDAKTTALQQQVTDLKTQNAALTTRIAQLEGRVQAIEASLPDDNTAQSN